MSTTLQRLIAGQALDEVIRNTKPRKESGKIPADATIENIPPSEVQEATKLKQQNQAAAARSAKALRAQRNKAMKAEMFVREYANNGFNAAQAYQVISPKAKKSTCQANGTKMLSDTTVQNMLAAYLIKLREKYEVDHQFVWRGWVNHARANVMHYFEQGENGKLKLRDLEALPADLQRNIRKIKVTRTVLESKTQENGDEETVYSETIDLQLVDPQKAYDSMARALLMFDGEAGGGGEGGIADLIRGGVARIKSMGDLNAHKVVSEQ